MSLSDILDIVKKSKEVSYDLLGKNAGHALYAIIVIAALLYAARSFGGDTVRLIDAALLLCLLFGIVVTSYGIFTHQNIAGLRLQKGFAVGTIAGALAALTGGIAYYGINQSVCCHNDIAIKLFRLLEASVPMGALFGGLMGLLRPAGRRSARRQPEEVSKNFLSFVLGILFLLVLSLAYFYIFDNAGNWSGAEPQGLLRFWQVSVLLISFVAIYVFLIVYLYGRADEVSKQSTRLAKATSSTVAVLFSAAMLFSLPIIGFADKDFKERSEVTVCESSATGRCTDCVEDTYCPNDPKSINSLEAILFRTLILIVLVFSTYLCATHPRSLILKKVDQMNWLGAANK